MKTKNHCSVLLLTRSRDVHWKKWTMGCHCIFQDRLWPICCHFKRRGICWRDWNGRGMVHLVDANDNFTVAQHVVASIVHNWKRQIRILLEHLKTHFTQGHRSFRFFLWHQWHIDQCHFIVFRLDRVKIALLWNGLILIAQSRPILKLHWSRLPYCSRPPAIVFCMQECPTSMVHKCPYLNIQHNTLKK